MTGCSQWHTTIISSPTLMVSAFGHTELWEIQVLGPVGRVSSTRRISTTQMNFSLETWVQEYLSIQKSSNRKLKLVRRKPRRPCGRMITFVLSKRSPLEHADSNLSQNKKRKTMMQALQMVRFWKHRKNAWRSSSLKNNTQGIVIGQKILPNTTPTKT